MEDEAAFARTLTHAQFVSFVDTHLLSGKLLAVWITTAESGAEDVETPEGATVLGKDADLAGYHASQKLYTRPTVAPVVTPK